MDRRCFAAPKYEIVYREGVADRAVRGHRAWGNYLGSMNTIACIRFQFVCKQMRRMVCSTTQSHNITRQHCKNPGIRLKFQVIMSSH